MRVRVYLAHDLDYRQEFLLGDTVHATFVVGDDNNIFVNLDDGAKTFLPRAVVVVPVPPHPPVEVEAKPVLYRLLVWPTFPVERTQRMLTADVRVAATETHTPVRVGNIVSDRNIVSFFRYHGRHNSTGSGHSPNGFADCVRWRWYRVRFRQPNV